ncbi:MAG: DUF7521 family protein [Methanobacteriota archaeon]
MVATELALAGIKAVTVALGFWIVYLGWKAARARGSRAMLWFTVGMVLMTVGAISEGLAFQGLRWTLDQSHIAEAGVTLVAFGVLVYSLYA